MPASSAQEQQQPGLGSVQAKLDLSVSNLVTGTNKPFATKLCIPLLLKTMKRASQMHALVYMGGGVTR